MKRLALLVFLSTPAFAFEYEVLQPETVAHEAGTVDKGFAGGASGRVVLLDGEVQVLGTETTQYDRVFINQLRAYQQFPLASNLNFRLTFQSETLYQKQESKEVPRVITEASWVEMQPRLELIYSTQNALDIVIGVEDYYISTISRKSEVANFTAKDSYQSVNFQYPHLAIVKRNGNYDAGFAFVKSAEKTRRLNKTNSLDSTSIEVDDVVFMPTSVSLFYRGRAGFGSYYGEFAAVEASGGGNKTPAGATVEEDYFRVHLGGAFNLIGPSLRLEPTLIYKSLSYADNRNVTLDTIPGFGLHLNLVVDQGLPAYIGLIGVRGKDGQSLTEFNAKYKLYGYGAAAGVNWKF